MGVIPLELQPVTSFSSEVRAIPLKLQPTLPVRAVR